MTATLCLCAAGLSRQALACNSAEVLAGDKAQRSQHLLSSSYEGAYYQFWTPWCMPESLLAGDLRSTVSAFLSSY